MQPTKVHGALWAVTVAGALLNLLLPCQSAIHQASAYCFPPQPILQRMPVLLLKISVIGTFRSGSARLLKQYQVLPHWGSAQLQYSLRAAFLLPILRCSPKVNGFSPSIKLTLGKR